MLSLQDMFLCIVLLLAAWFERAANGCWVFDAILFDQEPGCLRRAARGHRFAGPAAPGSGFPAAANAAPGLLISLLSLKPPLTLEGAG